MLHWDPTLLAPSDLPNEMIPESNRCHNDHSAKVYAKQCGRDCIEYAHAASSAEVREEERPQSVTLLPHEATRIRVLDLHGPEPQTVSRDNCAEREPAMGAPAAKVALLVEARPSAPDAHHAEDAAKAQLQKDDGVDDPDGFPHRRHHDGQCQSGEEDRVRVEAAGHLASHEVVGDVA